MLIKLCYKHVLNMEFKLWLNPELRDLKLGDKTLLRTSETIVSLLPGQRVLDLLSVERVGYLPL